METHNNLINIVVSVLLTTCTYKISQLEIFVGELNLVILHAREKNSDLLLDC